MGQLYSKKLLVPSKGEYKSKNSITQLFFEDPKGFEKWKFGIKMYVTLFKIGIFEELTASISSFITHQTLVEQSILM